MVGTLSRLIIHLEFRSLRNINATEVAEVLSNEWVGRAEPNPPTRAPVLSGVKDETQLDAVATWLATTSLASQRHPCCCFQLACCDPTRRSSSPGTATRRIRKQASQLHFFSSDRLLETCTARILSSAAATCLGEAAALTSQCQKF